MSFECVNWAYEQELKPGPKFVLVTLANIADQNGVGYPGQQYIAQRTGFTDRSVLSHLAYLEERGLIKRSRRTTAIGTRTSDLSQLQVPWLDSQPARFPSGQNSTRKNLQSYPKKAADRPEKFSGESSETPKRTARGGALPSQWKPPTDVMHWSKDEGFDDETIERELAKFRDHARAKGRTCHDWNAAFRNWLRQAQDFDTRRRRSFGGDRRDADGIVATGARLAARRADGGLFD